MKINMNGETRKANTDTQRLQFILDSIMQYGIEGFTYALNHTPWTVYVHDGEDTVSGFDRRTIDWMMKRGTVIADPCKTHRQVQAALRCEDKTVELSTIDQHCRVVGWHPVTLGEDVTLFPPNRYRIVWRRIFA